MGIKKGKSLFNRKNGELFLDVFLPCYSLAFYSLRCCVVLNCQACSSLFLLPVMVVVLLLWLC